MRTPTVTGGQPNGSRRSLQGPGATSVTCPSGSSWLVSDLVLRAYHRLPAPLKTLAASARGLILSRSRFGPETERLVAEALERETWSRERWQAWQDERVREVLHRARTEVPYYREWWAERRRRGDRASPERLENWPLLEKSVVRENPRAFIADDCRQRRMLRIHTSGTTAKPVSISQVRAAVRSWTPYRGSHATLARPRIRRRSVGGGSAVS